jgi:transposase
MERTQETCTNCEVLKARIERLESELARALAKIVELERRFGLNSSNSSKPPSSDGLRKQTINKREKSDKPFGGQAGHEGKTLQHVDNPDEIRDYHAQRCAGCNASLSDAPIVSTEERQEYTVVMRRHVIAHRVHTKQCANCKGRTSCRFPEHVKNHAQYGTDVRALAVYLAQHHISKDRIRTIMEDCFAMPISDTALIAYDAQCAERLAPFMELIREQVMNAPVKHADETGIRVAGTTKWIHTLSTLLWTLYRIGTRGSMPDDAQGIIIHDHWKSYLKLTSAQHAFCNAHHIRELKAVHEIDLEPWAEHMIKLLVEASKLTNPSIERIAEIERTYDIIVAEGLVFHSELGPPHQGRRKKRTGHNLLLRLQKFKTETLLFLHNKDVPFTNNLAERDLRMIKLHQKVSGCFRTTHGAEHFVAIRSFVSTLRKQGASVLHALNVIMTTGFSKELLPALIP